MLVSVCYYFTWKRPLQRSKKKRAYRSCVRLPRVQRRGAWKRGRLLTALGLGSQKCSSLADVRDPVKYRTCVTQTRRK